MPQYYIPTSQNVQQRDACSWARRFMQRWFLTCMHDILCSNLGGDSPSKLFMYFLPLPFPADVFWLCRDTTPCSPLKVKRHLGGKCLYLQLCFPLASCWFLAWLILRPRRCSSVTSFDLRRCIPGDRALHNRRCENLKSYIYVPF
jgi:hypothetical protein